MNDLEPEELNKLFSYWINHNKQHEKEIEKWIKRIKKNISEDITQDLTKAMQLFEEINKRFESAKKKLESDKNKLLDKKWKKKESSIPKENKSINKFEFKEIGTIHTPYTDNAPYQPVDEDKGDFQIILNPEYVDGLHALEKFTYIYVIYYIHRISREEENIVSPPWTGGLEVGIFASRSPVRPNPIGLSIVKVKKIVDNKIFTSGLDVFDGTPLLDIKPYIKDLDSKKDANYGWIKDLDEYEHLLLHIKGIPHDY